jgi:1,4-alpha-glucan branching enzyme
MTRTDGPPDALVYHDPLDAESIAQLVAGRHGAPFDVLGPRIATLSGRSIWIVRAWLPGALAAWLIPQQPPVAASDGAGETPVGPLDGHAETPRQRSVPMRQLHPAGLFSAVLPVELAGPYELEVQRPSGAVERVTAPYAFPPALTDFDLHLIGEGTHHELYQRLGAHPIRLNGVEGTRFAVWAPNARRVSVVGDFNGWDERAAPMRLRPGGVWELFLPGVRPGALYKYAILSWNGEYRVLKADPFAFAAELRPGTASRVWELGGYQWGDAEWLTRPGGGDPLGGPICVYELHAGSWRPSSAEGSGPPTYRDLAHQLVPYLTEMGYTHVELLPILEHPFDGSWGYQVTGYYAPTARYGSPQDFMYFVDYCHQHGIGVLLDWVPAHFPKDQHGLAFFDGSQLYEHADQRLGEHPEWGTLIFNYGRNQVRNFLLANALFWLDVYHLDGLRVDAVASMLYLDYGRKAGEWLPNRLGGRENLEAIAFLRECNAVIHARFPHALTIAEESTAWPGVTAPVAKGGLGFSLKWNMGWMHDILGYMRYDPVHRSHHHGELTFSLSYAFAERYILALSHDEVVHIKGSLLNKMPGDVWQKFANLRALYAFMYAHPGKKLLFMGGELGEWSEWNFAGYLDWFVLNTTEEGGESPHAQLQVLVRDLNALLRAHPALYALDFSPDGFAWVDGGDTQHSVIAFLRYGPERSAPLLFVCNFTPVVRYNYRVGVPEPARYEEILNTDAACYGGTNVGNLGAVDSQRVPMHGQKHSLALTLPPLAVIALRPAGPPERVSRGVAKKTEELLPATEQAAGNTERHRSVRLSRRSAGERKRGTS